MDITRLLDHEGMPVAVLSKYTINDISPTIWSRGIVYCGKYHTFDFRKEEKASQPSLYLEHIDSDLIEEIIPLNEGQQSEIEKSLAEFLRGRIEKEITLKIPIVFSNGYCKE